MTRLTAAFREPASTRKHAFFQIAILLLVVSGGAWNFDALLFMRLRLAADDAFAIGDPEHPSLLLDASEELRAFPPARLAGFVAFPAPQIRSAACLALSERDNDLDPKSWIGVAPKLLQALATDVDPVARECVRAAVVNLPVVPHEDLGAIQSFVERAEDDSLHSVQTALVAKTVRANPDLLPWAIDFYGRWLDSADVDERRIGFNQLMELAPNAPQTIAAFRKLVDSGDPDGIAAADRRLLQQRPKLAAEYWNGNSAERRYVLACAADALRTATSDLCFQYRLRSCNLGNANSFALASWRWLGR